MNAENISKWLAVLAVVATLCNVLSVGFTLPVAVVVMPTIEDTVGKHTIEITCNSGTLYLGGLFVS